MKGKPRYECPPGRVMLTVQLRSFDDAITLARRHGVEGSVVATSGRPASRSGHGYCRLVLCVTPDQLAAINRELLP